MLQRSGSISPTAGRMDPRSPSMFFPNEAPEGGQSPSRGRSSDEIILSELRAMRRELWEALATQSRDISKLLENMPETAKEMKPQHSQAESHGRISVINLGASERNAAEHEAKPEAKPYRRSSTAKSSDGGRGGSKEAGRGSNMYLSGFGGSRQDSEHRVVPVHAPSIVGIKAWDQVLQSQLVKAKRSSIRRQTSSVAPHFESELNAGEDGPAFAEGRGSADRGNAMSSMVQKRPSQAVSNSSGGAQRSPVQPFVRQVSGMSGAQPFQRQPSQPSQSQPSLSQAIGRRLQAADDYEDVLPFDSEEERNFMKKEVRIKNEPEVVQMPMQAEAPGSQQTPGAAAAAATSGTPPQGALEPKSGQTSTALTGVLPGEVQEPQLQEATPRQANSRTRMRFLNRSDLGPLGPDDDPEGGPCMDRRQSLGRVTGQVDQVRRMVEMDIVQRCRSSDVDMVKMAPIMEKLDTIKPSLLERFMVPVAIRADAAAYVCMRVGGLVPWNPERFWLSLAYQVCMLLVHLAILAGSLARGGFHFSDLIDGMVDDTDLPFFISDVVISLGSVGGLLVLGVLDGGKTLQSCLHDLHDIATKGEFSESAAVSSGYDVCLTLLCWLCFVANRLIELSPAFPSGRLSPRLDDVLCLTGFFVSSGELLTIALVVMKVSRYMAAMVDAFCFEFWAQMGYRDAVQDWNVIQATLRMSCRTVELAFIVLQSTVVLSAMALVLDVSWSKGHEWVLISTVILLGGVSQIFLRAAAVTESCIRIPQLINATSKTADVMDQDRKYLVEYIVASSAGFYVFNVRFGVGVVARIFHYTGLVAVTLARLVRPF